MINFPQIFRATNNSNRIIGTISSSQSNSSLHTNLILIHIPCIITHNKLKQIRIIGTTIQVISLECTITTLIQLELTTIALIIISNLLLQIGNRWNDELMILSVHLKFHSKNLRFSLYSTPGF